MHFPMAQAVELRPLRCKTWRRSGSPLHREAGGPEARANQSTNCCVPLRGRSIRGTHPMAARFGGVGPSTGSTGWRVCLVPHACWPDLRQVERSKVQSFSFRAGSLCGPARRRNRTSADGRAVADLTAGRVPRAFDSRELQAGKPGSIGCNSRAAEQAEKREKNESKEREFVALAARASEPARRERR